MTQLTLSAWAKINLGLRIVSKREDGYHNLLTQFQRLSLADIVTLYPKTSGVQYFGPRITEKTEQNLVIRAAEEFIKHYKCDGIAITLTKRIPTGAGLGGGSSDAATVLRGMAMLHSIDPNDPELLKIATSIGSDTPFFLIDQASAIGRSKGELLGTAEGLGENLWVAILYPGFEISTARAYKDFDNSLTPPIENDTFEVHSLLRSISSGSGYYYLNDFEKIIFESHPELGHVRDEMITNGALSAGLAGSGSSLFAIFDDEAKARSAASPRRGSWLGFVCRPL